MTLSTEQLELLNTHPHIKDVLDEYGNVRSVQESKILAGHF